MISATRLRTLGLLAAFLIGLIASPRIALAEQHIKWKNLLPQDKPLVDPFDRLTQDQRFDIETIIWARNLSNEERGHDYNKQPLEDAKRYEEQFRKANINVDSLLKEYDVFQAKVAERNKLMNESLNGKEVKLAGYLLPLEFSEQGVTDFLLVPYVGACIHVPPPPPNQIVLVQLAKKMVVTDLYTPVWIRGRIVTKASSRSLTYVDGTRDIPIGYHIDKAAAEPYDLE